MTDTRAIPSAREIHSRWPGLVWAVPGAALLVVLYLAISALANPGVTATIVFGNGAGATPNDTKVIYRGVQVGHVTKVGLDKDGSSVDVTVRLEGRMRRQLTTSTVFWIEGSNFSLTDLSSLRAAVAGVTIDMATGPRGQPQRRFVGLSQAPAVMPDAKGTPYYLKADNLGPIHAGSTILWRGMEVGKVAATEVRGPNDLRAELFVFSPYDQLVRPGTVFWSVSPLDISLGGEGVKAGFNFAAAGGAITFETPDELLAQHPAPAATVFPLYGSQARAFGEGVGAQVLYEALFPTAVGGLAVGSPVMLGGFQVGSVREVGMRLDPRTGQLAEPVTLAIEPLRLHLAGVDPMAQRDWRPLVDQAMNALLARGYRVRLEQSPPLIGSFRVGLDPVGGAGAGHLLAGGRYPIVPASVSGDLGALGDKANTLLDHLNAVPLQQIGENARELTGRLAAILKSPKVTDAVDKLDDTLNQTDQMVREARPQIGPLVGSLRKAADQLDQTAASANAVLSGDGAAQDSSLPDALRQLGDASRSIRALADYLQRHPEALLKGKH